MPFLHLFPLLLLQFSSPFLISLAYTPPDKYFLNCGTRTNVHFGPNRRFIGDARPGGLPISPGKSKRVEDDTISNSIPEIYHTARVYDEPTWYVFNSINQNGTYVVRLHFFPHQNLPQARFNVSASCGFQLLSNFSVHNSGLKTPVVEEFAFELEPGQFGIQFSPLQSSLAFVNAIEVFLAPEEFKPNSSFALFPQLRINGSKRHEMLSEAFHTTYRVSVGGPLITPFTDTLWRTWLPDDEFLVFPSSAKNISYGGKIEYKEVTTPYTAPISVYNTAKELKMDPTGRSRLSNLTWVFKVKKNTKYFVVLHFCDIITEQPRTTFRFDYFLGSNRTDTDSSTNPAIMDFAKPFRYDFVVVSDNSGYFHTGVARNEEAPLSRAFLNGIEITELVEKSLVGAIVLTGEEKGKNLKSVIIGVCVGGAVMIMGLVIGLILCYFRVGKAKKSRPLLLPQSDPSEKILSIADLAPNLNLELKVSFEEIRAATDEFDEKKTIGVGGFGNVYRAKLGDKEVAVKRSRPGFGQGFKEFQTEVIILSQIRHRHLVTLYGYCDEGEEMILIYEYMEGGTLRDYLYGSETHNYPPLSWKQRLDICIDAAKGLDYLHTGSTAGVIIHRDIKTTNILLDKNAMAKVADFGISKSGVPNPEELDTTIRGTYGYLDPEYFNTGKLTEKSDVFSFGVVLLEVLSGRAPIVKSLPSEEINLADWAVLCKSKGEVEKLIDPLLVGTIEANSLRKFVEVAEMCVCEVGAKRPSMHDVVYDLELALQFQFTPTGGGKGFEGSTTIVDDAQWEIPSMVMGDESVMMDEDSTTVNARELVAQFKIDCAR